LNDVGNSRRPRTTFFTHSRRPWAFLCAYFAPNYSNSMHQARMALPWLPNSIIGFENIA